MENTNLGERRYYYIQRHASGYVGNCLLWWREGGNGYTCNIDEAEVFSGGDPAFQQIVKDDSKYTAWEMDYIKHCSHRHVDHQYINIDMSGVHKEPTQEEIDADMGADND